MSLLTEYSLWLLPLALLTGIGYALFLYFKNDNIIFEKKSKIIMAVLRGLAIALLAFLLLAPMIKLTMKQTEKPVLLFAIDNSESVSSNQDSLFYKQDFASKIRDITSAFDNKYEVKTWLVGENDRLNDDNAPQQIDFSDKSTNLSSLFDRISVLYANRNVGALVLFSDGIYNVGSNPYYKADRLDFPVYTVGLGSPEQTTDLWIAGVVHNKQTLKGNFFPVEIKVAATKLAGNTALLTVREGDVSLFQKQITISSSQHFETVKLSLGTKNAGLHRYRVDLQELNGELTHKNNHAQFYIEVVESKDKIAILYNSPHPDVAALKSALDKTENYDVEVMPIEEFRANPADYSLLVLHQVPSKNHPAANLLAQIRKGGTPTLYILGTQSDLQAFNALNAGLNVTQNRNLTHDATPSYNDNFTSFTFSDEAIRLLPNLPPMKTPFGTYRSSVSANTFIYQKVSGITTRYPLILFNDLNGIRSGVITGTGIWQWKLYDYLYAQNHDAFNEIVNKAVLFLASKGDRSKFRIHHATVFAENAPAEFTAELFNDSYELINDPDMKMTIHGGKDTVYEEQFSKQNNGYYLNVNGLPVGQYTWTVETRVGSKHYEKKGSFSVQPVMLETVDLAANHDLLKSIASQTGGKFYTIYNMQQVAEDIKKNENIKPMASYHKKYTLMLDSGWYFAAILLLFGVEWFLRKWGGGY